MKKTEERKYSFKLRNRSLLYYLKYGFYLWKKNKDRYSWLWCPVCSHDLNGDSKSFIKESKDRMYWFYKCDRCGCKSKWHLFLPIPFPDSHQKFTKKLFKYKK